MVRNDGNIRVGSFTVVQEKLGGLPLRLTFQHFLFEPPVRFGERQVRGAFQKFEHVHEFSESAAGHTILTDVVDVRLPWWLGGELATRLFVAPRLRRFFEFRHCELERLIREGVVQRAFS